MTVNKKIIIVDNFYSDPDAVRALAINSVYVSGAKYNYPGYQSSKRFVTNEIKEKFEELIGKQIDTESLERFTFGAFRIITKETGSMPKVHADTVIDWAGLIFLTPNAPMECGVGFYKHKETGLEGPPTDEYARELGFEDANEFEEKIVRRDMADLSKWDLHSFVGPVYNRLVLFRGGDLYHAPMSGLGESTDDSRITQNFFFNEKISI